MTNERDDQSTNVIAFPNPSDEIDYSSEFNPNTARLNIVIEIHRLEDAVKKGNMPEKAGEAEIALFQWSLALLEREPQNWVDWIYSQMANIQDSTEYVEIED